MLPEIFGRGLASEDSHVLTENSILVFTDFKGQISINYMSNSRHLVTFEQSIEVQNKHCSGKVQFRVDML